jgi:hypothetical protein
MFAPNLLTRDRKYLSFAFRGYSSFALLVLGLPML